MIKSILISFFISTISFGKEPWIPLYSQASLDLPPVDRMASEDLKDITGRRGDWGKYNGKYVYLPRDQSLIPSMDTIYLFNFLWGMNKGAYQCAVEPIRSYARKEVTLKRDNESWVDFADSVIYVFNRCLDIPGYFGKWIYSPLVRLESLLDWNYVWVLNSEQYFVNVTDKNHLIISKAFFKEFTSDAMLAALTYYGRLVGRENEGKRDIKEIDSSLKSGDFKKANALIRNQMVLIESFTVEKLKHSLFDREITDALVKKEFHPGSWYSVLKIFEYLQQKGISALTPIREHLGNLVFRLSNLKRYLDRNNYNKAGKILNSSEYIENMKKAGVELRQLDVEKIVNDLPEPPAASRKLPLSSSDKISPSPSSGEINP